MNVLSAATNHMAWLSARQQIAASNIAHADTPGFKAQAIGSFRETLDRAALSLAATQAGHIDNTGKQPVRFPSIPQNNAEVTLSGNDVVLEKEMRVIGENAKMFSFDANLVKSFHRMFLSSLKG